MVQIVRNIGEKCWIARSTKQLITASRPREQRREKKERESRAVRKKRNSQQNESKSRTRTNAPVAGTIQVEIVRGNSQTALRERQRSAFRTTTTISSTSLPSVRRSGGAGAAVAARNKHPFLRRTSQHVTHSEQPWSVPTGAVLSSWLRLPFQVFRSHKNCQWKKKCGTRIKNQRHCRIEHVIMRK